MTLKNSPAKKPRTLPSVPSSLRQLSAAEFMTSLKISDIHKGGCSIEHSYECMMDMHLELVKIESEQQDVIEMEKLLSFR